VTAATLQQSIAMPRRNDEPAFVIEREIRTAAKHRIPLIPMTKVVWVLTNGALTTH
jgi:hypothetical protein